LLLLLPVSLPSPSLLPPQEEDAKEEEESGEEEDDGASSGGLPPPFINGAGKVKGDMGGGGDGLK
jgi:hypothetical protein